MNKLKHIGLSALAGSLVSLSAAQAGGVSVNGAMEISYTNLDATEVTGNKLGQKKNISFTGSGEFSNGWTYGVMHAQTDGMDGLSSSSMNINMGGIVSLAYDSGTGSYGANAVDNIVPTAWEEIDYGFTTGITDLGDVSKTKGVVNITLKAPGSGTAVSYSYAARMGGNHTSDGATDSTPGGAHHGHDLTIDLLNAQGKYFGWRLGSAAQKIDHQATCKSVGTNGADQNGCVTQYEDAYGVTAYNVMRAGPLSVGFQATYKDPGSAVTTAVANNKAWVAGAAFTVGNYLSVSYGKGYDEYQWNTHVYAHNPGNQTKGNLDKEHANFYGWSAAMNWGPLALKAVKNRVRNEGGTGSNAHSHNDINLSMAF
jgi:hypothetical protein